MRRERSKAFDAQSADTETEVQEASAREKLQQRKARPSAERRTGEGRMHYCVAALCPCKEAELIRRAVAVSEAAPNTRVKWHCGCVAALVCGNL